MLKLISENINQTSGEPTRQEQMAQRDTTGRVTPARGKIIKEILSNVSSLKTLFDFICSILLRDILTQSLKKYCLGHIKSDQTEARERQQNQLSQSNNADPFAFQKVQMMLSDC